MGNFTFDASTVPPSKAFDPLPAGWYRMRITKAEIKGSEKAGDMLALEHEIDEQAHPEHRGRKVFSNLCINHQNVQAREIARRTLSALCHAIGVLQLTDTTQLLGKVLQVKLRPVPAKDGYDAKNEVSGYRPMNGDEVAGVSTQPAASTPAAAGGAPVANGGAPGWRNRK